MDEQEICPAALEELPEETKEEAEEPPKEDAKALTIEALNARIWELEELLAQREAVADRMMRECEEFESYFPEVTLRQVPAEVWNRVQAGIPLAAAYALYERGIRNQATAAQEQPIPAIADADIRSDIPETALPILSNRVEGFT